MKKYKIYLNFFLLNVTGFFHLAGCRIYVLSLKFSKFKKVCLGIYFSVSVLLQKICLFEPQIQSCFILCGCTYFLALLMLKILLFFFFFCYFHWIFPTHFIVKNFTHAEKLKEFYREVSYIYFLDSKINIL